MNTIKFNPDNQRKSIELAEGSRSFVAVLLQFAGDDATATTKRLAGMMDRLIAQMKHVLRLHEGGAAKEAVDSEFNIQLDMGAEIEQLAARVM